MCGMTLHMCNVILTMFHHFPFVPYGPLGGGH